MGFRNVPGSPSIANPFIKDTIRRRRPARSPVPSGPFGLSLSRLDHEEASLARRVSINTWYSPTNPTAPARALRMRGAVHLRRLHRLELFSGMRLGRGHEARRRPSSNGSLPESRTILCCRRTARMAASRGGAHPAGKSSADTCSITGRPGPKQSSKAGTCCVPCAKAQRRRWFHSSWTRSSGGSSSRANC